MEKERLEKAILLLTHRLKQFDKEELATENGNIAYNKLLIEKAVLKQQLATLQCNPLQEYISKCYRKISGEKLICDRF